MPKADCKGISVEMFRGLLTKYISQLCDEVNLQYAHGFLGNVPNLLVACYEEGSHKALYDKSEAKYWKGRATFVADCTLENGNVLNFGFSILNC